MGLLEKRVKSRFSHNQIVLFNHLSLEDYVTLFRDLLTLPGKDMFVTKWNTSVKSLSAHPDVVAVLEEQYSQTKDVRTLKKFLVVVVCSCLSQGLKTVSLKDLEFARSLFSVDSKETILKSLTVLEMMLVVATRRVKDVRPNSPINFEMVYRGISAVSTGFDSTEAVTLNPKIFANNKFRKSAPYLVGRKIRN
jgi:origin recognition complex subunit 4